DVVRIRGEHLFERRTRAGEIAHTFERPGALERRLRGARHVPGKELPNLGFRYESDEVLDDRAVFEQDDGRQTAHAQLLSKRRFFIGVDLCELEAASVLLR